MKKQKNILRKDSVQSNTFHVGIELETHIECCNSTPDCGCNGDHNDEACSDNMRDSLDVNTILRDYLNLSQVEANAVKPYFNFDSWKDDYMNDWECDDSDCPFIHNCEESECESSNDGESDRDELESVLRRLTNNTSIKVVEDGSISHDSERTDAEVCWNYFASKETIRDNEIILEALKEHGAKFNKSCGLHINLNNYLRLDATADLQTRMLAPLFNFVAESRAQSGYCNRLAHSRSQKYSMLYNQGDRIEFRFFSPTFEAEKLNAYVHLANVVYKRLAGKQAKLSKKVESYFIKKMTTINGLNELVAQNAVNFVNSLPTIEALLELQNKLGVNNGCEVDENESVA